MPYKEDGKDIPKYVKEKLEGKDNSEKLSRQWAKVYNGTFKRTGSDGNASKTATDVVAHRMNADLFKKMTDYSN